MVLSSVETLENGMKMAQEFDFNVRNRMIEEKKIKNSKYSNEHGVCGA